MFFKKDKKRKKEKVLLCETCYYKKQGDDFRCNHCKAFEYHLYIQESTYKGIGIPLDAPLGFQVHGRYLSDEEKKVCKCSICERELKGEII